MTSDVKKSTKNHLLYLTLFLCCLIWNLRKKWASDQNSVCFTLVQELGRHLQWSKDINSILKQCKMSRTLHVNIFIYMVYFLCSNWSSKTKGSAPVTLSRFKPRFTTTHPDLRQMVKSGCIGMRRDGKREIQASIRCLTILLRCLHDSSTDPLRLMTAALRFTTVELRMLTMPPRFDTVLVQFKPVALR